MTTRPPHRSVSQLSSFFLCGTSYHLDRVLKLPSAPAAWFVQGTAVHAAVEAYESYHREFDPDQVLNVFETSWKQEVERAFECEPDPDRWMKSGMKKTETDLTDRHERGSTSLIGESGAGASGDHGE